MASDSITHPNSPATLPPSLGGDSRRCCSMTTITNPMIVGEEGISVVGSTLSDLDVVVDVHKDSRKKGPTVPVHSFTIGGALTKENVDFMLASLMRSNKKEYAVIFAINVMIAPEVLEYAHQVGVKIVHCCQFSKSDTVSSQFKAFLQSF